MGDLPTERAVFVPSPFVRQPLLEDAERDLRAQRAATRMWKGIAVLLVFVSACVLLNVGWAIAAAYREGKRVSQYRVDLAEQDAQWWRERSLWWAEQTSVRTGWFIEEMKRRVACERERDAPRVLHVRPDGSFMWSGHEEAR